MEPNSQTTTQGDGTNAGAGAQAQGATQQQGTDATANQNPQQQGAQGTEDYKVKFGESSREVNRMLDIFKQHGIDPKTGQKIEVPQDTSTTGMSFTDEELEAAVPGYSAMSPEQQAMVKNIHQFPKVAEELARISDRLKFQDDLDEMIEKPEYEIVAKNLKEFKKFAYQKENVRVPLATLAAAFIGTKLQSTAQQQQTQQKPQAKGMEQGATGQGTISKNAQVPDSNELQRMRTENPREYAKMLRKQALGKRA